MNRFIPWRGILSGSGAEASAPGDYGGGAGFVWGGALFLAVFAVLLAQELGWWLGVHLGGGAVAAGALSAAVVTGIQKPGLRRRLSGCWIAGGFSIGVLFAMLYGLQDPSWDGPAYHAPGAVQMLQGWNPVHAETGRWILDQYPHGPWAVRAALVDAAGGDLSAGRMLIVLAAMGLFAMAAEFIGSALRLRPAAATAVAALLVLNPVVVGQVWTDYVDGLLGIYALAFLLALFALRGPRPGLALLLAVCLAVLTATTKAAGLYYVFVLALFGLVWHVWQTAGDKKSLLTVLGGFAALSGMVVLLLVITAWRPYATNLQDHEALVYPPADRVLAHQRPANLQDAGPGTRALYLLFSEGRSGRGQGDPLTLRPWDVSGKALTSALWDSRSGGFGGLFGVQMLIAAGLAMWAAASGRYGDGRLLYAAVACLGATVAFPESWWARFVPLAWAASIFLAAPVLGGVFGGGKARTLSAFVFTVLVAVNSLPFAATGWGRAQDRTDDFFALAEKLRKEPAVALEGHRDNFFDISYGYMLEREGVVVFHDAECEGDVLHTGYSGYLTVCRAD